MSVLLTAAVLASTSCSQVGLLRDPNRGHSRRIPDRLKIAEFDENPQCIIYGDNRPGWRVRDKFLAKESWWTWKQFIVGFYQLYLLGEGFVGSVNAARKVPDYGEKQARWARDAVYAEAIRSDVDFILNVGDIATDGRRPRDWETFLRQYRDEVPVVTDYPYFAAIGNHERANDSTYGMPNYKQVFGFPRFYVIRCPDVDFFITDSNLLVDQYGFIDDATQEQLIEQWFLSGEGGEPSWLESELETSDKAFKVVIMHHPPIAFGKHHANWNDPEAGPDLVDKRRRLLEMFGEKGVQVVFSGHQHNYEHSLLKQEERGDVHIIITGGAGSPLHRAVDAEVLAERRANFESENLDAAFLKQEVIYNYCLVDVTRDQLTIRVYEASGKPETNGRLVDTVTLNGLDTGS